jgi:hypothetical protein
MNFQDISDFLDLVKNPKKAEDLLKSIKDQQTSLDDSIKVVGKVSEIDTLKVKAQKALETANKQAESILTQATAAAVKRQEVYDSMFEELRNQTEAVNAKAQEANIKLERALTLTKDINSREKKLREAEGQVSSESQRLSVLVAEYEEKLAKLKSVMV